MTWTTRRSSIAVALVLLAVFGGAAVWLLAVAPAFVDLAFSVCLVGLYCAWLERLERRSRDPLPGPEGGLRAGAAGPRLVVSVSAPSESIPAVAAKAA